MTRDRRALVILREGEFVHLLLLGEVPQPDRAILTQRNQVSIEGMHLRPHNATRVRSHHRSIGVVADVEHTQSTRRRATCHLQPIQRHIQRRDDAFVFGLDVELREVEGPHPQELVHAARHAESRRHHQ